MLSVLAISNSFSLVPFSTHCIQAFIPNYLIKAALIKITNDFCMSKFNRQVSDYILLNLPSSFCTIDHFLPYTLSLDFYNTKHSCFSSTSLDPPSQPPFLAPLFLLVLLLLEFSKAFFHKLSILWLFYPPHRFSYHLQIKKNPNLFLYSRPLSLSKSSLMNSATHSI